MDLAGRSCAGLLASLSGEARALVRLAVPVMVAQGGLVAMGLVDTLVLGRVSTTDMAAVAVGNTVTTTIAVLALGLTMGIEPLASQAFGAGEREGARMWFRQGLWLAAVGSLPVMLLILLSTRLFVPFGLDEEVASLASRYMLTRIPGTLFNGLYGACRSFLTSVQRPRPIVIAVLLANVVNAGLDLLLVFGFGLGVEGVGWATSLSWVLMFGVTAFAATRVRTEEGERPGLSLLVASPDAKAMRRIAAVGWPIGLQLSVEVGIFALVTGLIGRLGAAELAGHQIALTLASFTFMCCVGLAVSATARVGFFVGARDGAGARRSGLVAMVLGALFMGACGVAFLLFPTALATLFSPKDPRAVEAGARLLRIAAFFSVFDGLQVVASGALRGAGDTRSAFYVNAGMHWLVGLPVGLWLAERMTHGSVAFWWGLTVGLAGVGLILCTRFVVLASRPIVRL